jgi:metallo-beta-lactamase family protein
LSKENQKKKQEYLGGDKMQLSFCGAAQTVTGSCCLVEAASKRFIVDCGMFQGSKELRAQNRQQFRFNPGELDFMLLTHAHIDHSGLIPKLCQAGFISPIYATKATVDLCRLTLPDSGHIQELEAEWRSRKNIRRGLAAEEPLYTAADALASLEYFKAVDYLIEFEPAPGIRVRFSDAGHILGSAIIEIWVHEADETIKIVFSGDLGQQNQPIIQDPTVIETADYLVIESTYGNRRHEDNLDKVQLLKEIILEAVRSKGNLIIPSFAIGRTQDLLYYLRNLLLDNQIPSLPVYIDSPMAVSVTENYQNNPGYYDAPTLEMIKSGNSPFEFPKLHYIRTAKDSKLLNETAKGAIIISASGMCEAGRILHHLKHNLWRPEAHVLFVGYQAEGTLGRRLLEGAKVVKIFGEEVDVQAKIHSIGGFSAHADQQGLLTWLQGLRQKPRRVFIVHGENTAQQALAALIKQKLGMETQIPALGDSFTLSGMAAFQEVSAKLFAPSAQLAAYYGLDRVVTDLEHTVLNLHNGLRRADSRQTATDLATVKQLVAKLETFLENNQMISGSPRSGL